MEKLLMLSAENLSREHICCAISDKKCSQGYELKKEWLLKAFDEGYVFRRLDARAKVFIEYGPAELGWVPVVAPGYLLINCFWVSGKYKKQGYGKTLLKGAVEDALLQGKSGLVTVVGTEKFHFMSDGKWLKKQGFLECQRLPSGFSLLVMALAEGAVNPVFGASTLTGECEDREGIVVFFSNRCPFVHYHVMTSLVETASRRGIPCKVHRLETPEQAQSAPSPSTIFSLFYNGKFVTTDVSVCMDNRFDKVVQWQ